MNFSFELSGALLTGSMNQEAMEGIGVFAGAILGGLGIVAITVLLALAALMIISRWRVFQKAGLPGWGAIVPFYNIYLTFKIGGRSGRNVLWILIPPVFPILMIINAFNITERFGKHWTFGLGLIFLKFIFIPILAFDNSKYLGEKTSTKATPRPIIKSTTKPVAKVIAKPVVKKATKPIAKTSTKPAGKRSTVKSPAKKPINKKK